MSDCLAVLPPLGGYFSLAKVIFLLVLAIPWLLAAPWVYHDAQKFPGVKGPWGGIVLACGAVGVFAWMLVPMFWLGLTLYIVLLLSAMIAYVVYRDGQVEDEYKLLSAEGIKAIFSKPEKFSVITRVKLYDTHLGGKIVPVPNPEVDPIPECKTYNLVQEFLEGMFIKRASEADISPVNQEKAAVRFVVDGVVTNEPPLDVEESEVIIQYIKKVANLDLEERRKPQEGDVMIDFAGRSSDVKVTVAGTTGGQRLRLKVSCEAVQTRIDELGLGDSLLPRLKEINQRSNGLIIVSGKKGSGVTSTLYSLLRNQDAFIKQLVTLEAKPEVDLENISQSTYDGAKDRSEKLAAMLRRAPDVVMIDSCDDAETANAIMGGAQRHLIILGVPASDSFSALAKWLKLCGDAKTGLQSLHAITCQCLIRKLCTGCREAYRPDPALLAKANLKADSVDVFYRPPKKDRVDEKGNPIVCPVCQEIGYVGRTGVFELLEVTDDIRQLVAQGGSLSHIKAACRKNGMLYLQENALKKVSEGVTSVQEVIRVTQQTKQHPKK